MKASEEFNSIFNGFSVKYRLRRNSEIRYTGTNLVLNLCRLYIEPKILHLNVIFVLMVYTNIDFELEIYGLSTDG